MSTDRRAWIIRHSDSDFPHDRLTVQGKERAERSQKLFAHFRKALSSPKLRAIETAHGLGFVDVETDLRLSELELGNINAPNAHEYVLEAHRLEQKAVEATGQLIQSILSESIQSNEPILIVSHNLAISALLQILTGQIDSFNYLEGIEVGLDEEGNLFFVKKIP